MFNLGRPKARGSLGCRGPRPKLNMISPNFREAKIKKFLLCKNFAKSLISQKKEALSS